MWKAISKPPCEKRACNAGTNRNLDNRRLSRSTGVWPFRAKVIMLRTHCSWSLPKSHPLNIGPVGVTGSDSANTVVAQAFDRSKTPKFL